MEFITYNDYDSPQTKVDKALSVFPRVERVQMVEYPCRNHESAKDLAETLKRLDLNCVISLIEIFSTFIRVHRAADSGFKFGAVIHDIVRNPRLRQERFSRP